MNTLSQEEQLFQEAKKELIAFCSDIKKTPEEIIQKLEDSSPELLNDIKVAKELINHHPMIYHRLPEKLKLNHNFALEFISNNPGDFTDSYALSDLPSELFKNKEFSLKIFNLIPSLDIYTFLDNSFKDKEFNFQILEINPECYEGLPTKDREDPAYLDFVIHKFPQSLFFAPKSLQEDLKYLDILFHHPDRKKSLDGYVLNEYEDWLEKMSPIYFIKREQDWLEKNTPVNNSSSVKANKF